ncbi:nucleoside-diphosphate sugar epimerase/dehydratase [uncultured Erythrobacter sp.]|uniref:polysaccharide biosynthesis protein n=1 Tax=uncultured Erythrobacter sp. TaxID=263913 RepID=UPI00260414B4|nr:nucleoside-diphosphate sugar epimerase/dehydratase [uncultured Erythrobacter sp.]
MNWPRPAKRLAVMALDAMLCAIAVWIAFSLRIGDLQAPNKALLTFTGAMLCLWYPIALLRGVYSAIFRFSGRGAIIGLTLAVSLLTVPMAVLFMAIPQDGVPRTMAILGPIVFFLLVALSRIVGRYVLVDLFNARSAGDMRKHVVIYGAGATGQMLASALGVESGMRVIGFIDDDRAKWGRLLDGRRVYRSAQVADLARRRGVTDIVLAMSEISFSRRKQIIAALEPLSVNVQTLPPMRDLMAGRISADALRPIEVEDLLGRPVVPQHGDLLARQVRGKLVMVTGAGGSIGSEICRQILAQRPAGLVMVEANEFALFQIERELDAALVKAGEAARPALYARLADVSNPAAVARLFAEFSPQTIFHAAAYKHVPLVEDNVVEAVRNNVMGARLMARGALGCGSERFVLISTDKAVRPPNVMGASKRMCEIILQDLARRSGRSLQAKTVFSMVRFGNVLGSSGSVVPIFRRQIEAGGPITVTHREVTRYFMTIFEAAQLVIQAGAMARGGEVFLLDMGEPVKIWDLARSMVRLAGLSVRDADNPAGDIEIVEHGLRPGEKLYEELLLGEHSEATEHPRIMQGNETCPAPRAVASVLAELDEAIARGDENACKAALKSLVPTLRFEPKSAPDAPDAPAPTPIRPDLVTATRAEAKLVARPAATPPAGQG